MRRSLFFAIVIMTLMFMGSAHAGTLGGIFDLTRPIEGRSMRSSSADPNWKNGNADCRGMAPGETLVIADLEGPGVITHIWNTVAAQERGYSRLLTIQIYWDGEVEPSVSAPLGDFFGVGHGMDAPLESLPVRVTSEGRARNCYWPMPFRQHAKIVVTNEGRAPVIGLFWYVDWRRLDTLPDDTLYFHASYRQEHPVVMGRNYLLADIKGRGHYVGTVFNIRQRQPSWWGEGDDFFFIDGEEEPSIRGTGSEDYLCDAWGMRKLEGPYYGAPICEPNLAYARMSAYRWHAPDPVSFLQSLRVEIEHKGVMFDSAGVMISGFEERSDDLSSVAFWYQNEPHQALPALPPAYDRLFYDPAATVEFELLMDTIKASEGALLAQESPTWSGGKQILWSPASEGQTLDIPIEAPEAGDYILTLIMTRSFDYGKYSVELDSIPLGVSYDYYSEAVVPAELVLHTGQIAAGSHILTFRNAGKSSESKGVYLGLDGYLFAKVAPAP